MKKILAILAITALALPAFSQFISGPHVGTALVCPATGWKVNNVLGVSGTNIPAASAPVFSLHGSAPVTLYANWSATNTTTGISNLWVFLQYSSDGVNWLGPNAQTAFAPATVGVVRGPGAAIASHWQLLHDGSGGPGVAITNLSSLRYLKVYALSNHTAGADSNIFWITNMWFIQGNR